MTEHLVRRPLASTSVALPQAAAALLEVEQLSIGYRRNGVEHATVHEAGLAVREAETVAIVGESGSGKSTLLAGILGLLPEAGVVTAGSVRWRGGDDLLGLPAAAMRRFRRAHVGFVPQNPMTSLNPVRRIGAQFGDAGLDGVPGRERHSEMLALLDRVGLPHGDSVLESYPHQLSGGMQQRVLIAMALAGRPELIVADEPTSALDVTVQKQILDHLGMLTRESGISLLLVTHDIALAAERASRIVVMQQGRIVEQGPSAEVIRDPRHDYTRRLVAAVPAFRLGFRYRSPAAAQAAAPELVRVENLSRSYPSALHGQKTFYALRDANLVVRKGRTTALVGESGSGKTTLARIVLGLTRPSSGRVLFEGDDIGGFSARQMRTGYRRRVQPVFQNPHASLNPAMTVGQNIADPLVAHGVGSRAARRQRVAELMDQVRLPRDFAERSPSELSGGQRQRVAIARALALQPELVVCDEPLSALDVLIQDEIVRLLVDLQEQLSLTHLFVSHDLSVVRAFADEIAVMQAGRIVESGSVADVFERPQTEYTRALLTAIPGGAFGNRKSSSDSQGA